MLAGLLYCNSRVLNTIMNKRECIDVVYYQTMSSNGFLSKLRENQVDEQGFSVLISALKFLSEYYKQGEDIDRLVTACLFEAPWEVENCVPHYASQSKPLGSLVSKMGEDLREVIHDMLWQGMEKFYKDL